MASATLSDFEGAIHSGRVLQAWQLFEQLLQQGLNPGPEQLSALVRRSSNLTVKQLHDVHDIVEYFAMELASPADGDFCCRLLDIRLKEGNSARADVLCHALRQRGIFLPRGSLCSLLREHGKKRDFAAVERVWSILGTSKFVNEYAFGCMIDACVRCQEMDRAVEIFHDMRERGLPPNTVIFTTLMKGFSSARNLSAALQLLQEMELNGIETNQITFNTLLEACVRCHDLATAEHLLEHMMQSNVSPDIVSFGTLIKGYAHAGALDKAMTYALRLKQAGIRIDEPIYLCLLECAGKCRDLDAGLVLVCEMMGSRRGIPKAMQAPLARLLRRVNIDGPEQQVDALVQISAELSRQHKAARP